MPKNFQETNYCQEIILTASPNQVFTAITQQLDLWWGQTDQPINQQGDFFTITFGEPYYWTFKIIEYVPNSILTWECIDGEPDFNRKWIGDKLYWKLVDLGDKTKLSFLQVGLNPAMNCYDICAPTWTKFICISLKSFVETGKAITF